MKEKLSVDRAECFCGQEIEASENMPDFSIDNISGFSWELTCPHCGRKLIVSPSIEWNIRATRKS